MRAAAVSDGGVALSLGGPEAGGSRCGEPRLEAWGRVWGGVSATVGRCAG